MDEGGREGEGRAFVGRIKESSSIHDANWNADFTDLPPKKPKQNQTDRE